MRESRPAFSLRKDRRSSPIGIPCLPGRAQPSGLQTISARDFDALAPHIAAWDRLAREAPQKNPYLLPGWVEAAFRHALNRDERWFCSFAYAGNQLVGVMPVIATPHPVLGKRYPILRTYDKHANSGEPLLAPIHAGDALRVLLQEVRRQEPKHLGLDLKAVRASSPLWQAVQGGIDGHAIRIGLSSSYSFLDVQGDFASYFSSSALGGMRNKLKRYRRRLTGRGRISVEMKRGPSVDESLLAEFITLEAAGWKGRNGTAIASSPDRTAFYSTLARNFAAQGYLEWHLIRVDGRLVAAEMGIRCGTSLFLPKIAYDEEFADCNPGSLLMEEALKDAFSRPEIAEYNPMSDAEWHKLWHLSRDSYVNVHLVRRGIAPLLFQLPRVTLRSAYQTYVRPRIPARARQMWRRLRRASRNTSEGKGA